MDDLLKKNLAAMAKWTPGAAELIGAAAVPAGYFKTNGADGSASYCRVVEGPPKKMEWLGGTSMPRAAAAAMTTDMERGNSSALGLGIGTGHEWLALVARLGLHQSLIVYEPDAAAARMALEVTDLSEQLASGRIVLVAGGSAGEQFAKFFRENLGFEVPTMLQQLPSAPMAERMAMRSAAEAMIRPAVIERTQRCNEIYARLGDYAPAANPPGVFFTAHSQWLGQRGLAAIVEAEEAAGKNVVALGLDRHASCSIAARLEALARHRPYAVRSDYFRSELGGGIPRELAIMTFVPPLAPYSYFVPERISAPAMGEKDVVTVFSAEHRAVLMEMGIAGQKIAVVPPALCEKRMRAEAAEAAAKIQMQTSVAMIGDLFPLDPKVYGFELPSHLSVWDACQALIAEDAREGIVCAHRAKDLFRRAQRRANVSLDDPVVAGGFERVIRHTLIRAASLAAIAGQLVEAGIPLKLIGRGWPVQELGAKARGAEYGPPAQMFDGVAVILHADPAAIVDPIVLAGMALGKAVVSLEHPHEAEDGGIASMFEPGRDYLKVRQKELIAALRNLLQDSDRRNKIGRAGQAEVLAAHTWERRWMETK